MTRPAQRFRRRELALLGGVFLLLFAAMQLLPVGAPRGNPPVVAEPAWDSPRTRELFFRACADCHSNQTRWPWYAKVAPVSWLVAHDVAEGREHFNVSEWHLPQKDAHEAAEELREGKMPPRTYLPAHAEARFDEATKRELVAGLAATFGEEGGPER
jgi:mono/diheme cytochrome c family protein